MENPVPELDEARKLAAERTESSHLQNCYRYNKRRNPIEFQVGDLVYIKNKNKIARRKLEEQYLGPYEIMAKDSKVIYHVKTENKNLKKIHIINMRQFKDPDITQIFKKQGKC